MHIKTYQGIAFDYTNPTKEMINETDIIYALSRINRFVGHSKRAYSVAEHSILCLNMANHLGYTDREKFLVLIHDFTEAYVGDCPAPLKRMLPEFSFIEEKVENAIYEYLGIEPPTAEEYEKIKVIDLTALVVEMRDLTDHDYTEFYDRIDMDLINRYCISVDESDEKGIRNGLFYLYDKHKELLEQGD